MPRPGAGKRPCWQKLFDMELKHLDLTFSSVMNMSVWHQEAVADMLRMSGKV